MEGGTRSGKQWGWEKKGEQSKLLRLQGTLGIGKGRDVNDRKTNQEELIVGTDQKKVAIGKEN